MIFQIVLCATEMFVVESSSTTLNLKPLRWSALAAVFLLAGCGPAVEERPPLHPVQGMLKVNGQPAEGAMIVLHPLDGQSFDSRGSRPRATVNADGTFELTTYQSGDGAPAGDYHVSILWFDNPDSDSPNDRLGGRFANPESNGLHVTIEENKSLIDPIHLDGVPLVTAQTSPGPPDYDQVD